MKKISFLILMAFTILSSCTKEKEKGGTNNTKLVILSSNEITNYSYITVVFPIGEHPVTDNKTPVKFRIGDYEQYAYPVLVDSLSNLYSESGYYAYQVLIPGSAQNTNKLSATGDNGKEYEFYLDIKKCTDIADPTEYLKSFKSFLTDNYQVISNRYNEAVLKGKLLKSTADSLNALMQKSLDEFDGFSSDITKEEKEAYVHMLEANKYLITRNFNEMAMYPLVKMGNIQEVDPCASEQQLVDDLYPLHYNYDTRVAQLRECKEMNATSKIETTNAYLSRLKSAHEAAKDKFNATSGWFGIKASRAYLKTFFSTAAVGIWEQILIDDNLTGNPFAQFSIENITHEKSSAVLVSGQEINFRVGVDMVNLNRESTGLSPAYYGIIDNIDEFNSITEIISEYFNIRKISIPALKSEKMYLTNYTIYDISDSRIKAEKYEKADGMKVKFTINTVVSSPVNFSYWVKVTSAFGTVKKQFFDQIQTNPCDGTLQLEVARNGKTLTATATGGKAPYLFSFGSGTYSAINTYEMIINGGYKVVVKDANNCTDTVFGQVCDVTIDSVKQLHINGSNISGLRIVYSSPLGLIPEFLIGPSYNNPNMLIMIITSSNSADYKPNIDGFCEGGFSAPLIDNGYITGTPYHRTITWWGLSGLSPIDVKFRLQQACGNAFICPKNGKTVYLSPEYSLHW